MSIEKLITELTEAIRENTAAMNAPRVGVAPAEPEPQQAESKPASKGKPKGEKAEAAKAEAADDAPAKADVTKKATELGKAKGTDVLRQLCEAFGVKKVTELKADQYATFIAAADAALNSADEEAQSEQAEVADAALTFDDVKAAVTQRVQAPGGREAVMAALKQFGVEKASELNESVYGEFIEAVKE